MPIVYSNDRTEPLKGNDIQALKAMLQGSLENHVATLKEYKSKALRPEDGLYYDPIIRIYENGIRDLSKNITKAAKSKETITAGQLIDSTFSDLTRKTMKVLDPNSESHIPFTNFVCGQWGNETILKAYGLDAYIYEKDAPDAFDKTASSFKFATEPMPGIENIGDYNPQRDRVDLLYKGRAGSSNTLSVSVEELTRKLEGLQEGTREYRETKSKLDNAVKGTFGLHAGGETARIHSSEWMTKEQVSFGDLYRTFTDLNKAVRPADPDAGRMRGVRVSAGNIQGVAASHVPDVLYKTLDTIAQHINEVKQEQDPLLRKTKAVQLASFAYQMTLSAHVFADGNGRTCRLFADTILQTFGLPPHTPPTFEEVKSIPKTFGATLGEPQDFEWGANYFLKGIQKSEAILAPERERLEAKKAEQVKEINFNTFSANLQNKGQQVRNDDNIIIRNDSNQLNRINIMDDPKPVRRQPAARPLVVTDETCKYLQAMHEYASEARGLFSDSPEYLAFHKALVDTEMKAKEIYRHRRDPKYDKNAAMREYTAQVNHLKDCAKAYEDYKLSDHTENPQAEPEKKRLNSDDRRKLDIVRNITNPKNVHLGPAQNVKKSGKENIM